MAIDLTARLRLQDDYSRKLQRASKETRGLSRATQSMAGAIARASAVAAAFGVGFGIASMTSGVVRLGATFDSTMSQVQAVTGATGSQLDMLSEKAKEMGETTKFSASQSAEAISYLGMAGFTSEQIMSSLEDTLNLAAAGGLELGRAADLASNVLTGFNMEAEEMGRVSDVLAKSAASANTTVEQMGGAMSYVAPIAQGLGLEFEETASAVGILSKQCIARLERKSPSKNDYVNSEKANLQIAS